MVTQSKEDFAKKLMGNNMATMRINDKPDAIVPVSFEDESNLPEKIANCVEKSANSEKARIILTTEGIYVVINDAKKREQLRANLEICGIEGNVSSEFKNTLEIPVQSTDDLLKLTGNVCDLYENKISMWFPYGDRFSGGQDLNLNLHVVQSMSDARNNAISRGDVNFTQNRLAELTDTIQKNTGERQSQLLEKKMGSIRLLAMPI